jgi:hypothetical protein
MHSYICLCKRDKGKKTAQTGAGVILGHFTGAAAICSIGLY